MTGTATIEFLSKALDDTSILETLESLASNNDDPAQAVADYADSLGFELSAADIKEVCAKLSDPDPAELSQDELDTISGGISDYQYIDEQLLELQRAMQTSSRFVSTLANIMKSQHDTANSIINNLRA